VDEETVVVQWIEFENRPVAISLRMTIGCDKVSESDHIIEAIITGAVAALV
jgi:hypothetical protein